MTANRKRFYTLPEYFDLVRTSDERYEYWHGEIFRNCRVFSSDIRIKVPTAPPFRYADVTVVCGEMEFEEIDGLKVLVNPILLVEVLSGTSDSIARKSSHSINPFLAFENIY